MRWRRGGDDRAPGTPTPARPAADVSADVPARDRPGDGVDPEASTSPSRVVRVPAQLGEVGVADLARARRRAVARALAEDLGEVGDLTTTATVPPTLDGSADLVARASGVVAGVDLVREVFEQVDPRVAVELRVADGDHVERGDVVAVLTGRLRSLLTGERVALNFVCHLSGVATQTRRFADAVDGTGAVVRDTRKTTPGLRLLEKAAVHAGGGANHRVGLYDALLVKDNHVLAAGGAGRAARQAVAHARGCHVQVEVSSVDQLDEVLAAGVTDVLLDNFTPDEVRAAVARVAGRASLEASGNVTLDTVRSYAETGVDRIATGSLTHSAPWLDLALDVRPLPAVDEVDTVPADEAAPARAATEDADERRTPAPGLWSSRTDA